MFLNFIKYIYWIKEAPDNILVGYRGPKHHCYWDYFCNFAINADKNADLDLDVGDMGKKYVAYS